MRTTLALLALTLGTLWLWERRTEREIVDRLRRSGL
jgi:hypothetical protein